MKGIALIFSIWKASTQKEPQQTTDEYLHGSRKVFESMGTAMVNLRPTSLNSVADGPTDIEYLKVYPNPFNGDILLEFSLTSATDVTIQIRNILGTVVINKKMEALEASRNQWIWDGQTAIGNEVAPGHYFLHMYCGAYMNREIIRVMKQ